MTAIGLGVPLVWQARNWKATARLCCCRSSYGIQSQRLQMERLVKLRTAVQITEITELYDQHLVK
eukprot:893388-Amphidinium_carterae.1